VNHFKKICKLIKTYYYDTAKQPEEYKVGTICEGVNTKYTIWLVAALCVLLLRVCCTPHSAGRLPQQLPRLHSAQEQRQRTRLEAKEEAAIPEAEEPDQSARRPCFRQSKDLGLTRMRLPRPPTKMRDPLQRKDRINHG